MSKHRKPDDLLDELSSLQSLLGDAARDVPAEDGGDDIPVLPPEEGAEGDAANQIPLLEPAPDGSSSSEEHRQARLRKEAMSRANPFLSPTSNANASTDQLEKQIAKTPSPAPVASPSRQASATTSSTTSGQTSAGSTALDDATLRALVDEVLAQWLPRIERELRNRLMDELRSRED